ncbi:hypothetical protein SAMN05443637_11535 [Pseudonocardia thermophila]|uniref:Metallo-beta-lactamase superfamily protein n=1 Tax=Pseudonocardia thermophila TaxID=1848 RepID=A0A1M6WPL9_PSETH|nr:hypothetical protein [Pseudonocardia thermophila]SHK95631.1 hypothetical protein SAMN05443637_11535 [Pseudonocardia thermophila]
MTTYDVEAFRIATLPVPGWEAFFGINDTEFHDLAFYIWHVTDGIRHALVDTGLPMDPQDLEDLDAACRGVDERSTFTDVVGIDRALEAFALRPEDIDAVLLTQTLTYHSGGLLEEFLPRAEVYMALPGVLEFLLDPPGHPAPHLYFSAPTWMFLRKLGIERRLHLVESEVEVWPGLIFDATGGHHPGSGGVRVRTAEGMLGILEAAFLERNITEIRPIGIAEDTARVRATIKRYLATTDLTVAGHEPGNATRFPVRERPAR